MSNPTPKFSSASQYDHEFFERLYSSRIDPWSVLTSAYERDKYEATLQALAQPHYRHALELGCSIGGLTRLLAGRCDAVTAVDTSAMALQRARELCQASNVDFVQAHLPDGDWHGPFDLVVLSEVLYYFSIPALVRLADRLSKVITPKTEFVVVHWTGETDYPLTGDRATELFQSLMRAELCLRTRHPKYRLERWVAAGGGCL
ncbi:class I SAM-dependent methyltransferase [Dyella kyungheensis]|jgi:cyclopropane fatty-acyl-phospholipid synthase-like methyltransferase|uniref:Class I SAM-dependent methyltransferase n=1 Tax=Dyella kyungheensis TaxID=1242174 RepID=A0ABS2JUZ0_9GAMM|nr:class I SAM-dependent methyltransferase [Dyella kyungheensis]MBM7122389.1 class I SAM-dependent methyltransferase [Dyella kyungheensis]